MPSWKRSVQSLEFYDVETRSEAHFEGINTVAPVIEKEHLKNLSMLVIKGLHLCISDNKFPCDNRR